jgi:hypothetical protein
MQKIITRAESEEVEANCKHWKRTGVSGKECQMFLEDRRTNELVIDSGETRQNFAIYHT